MIDQQFRRDGKTMSAPAFLAPLPTLRPTHAWTNSTISRTRPDAFHLARSPAFNSSSVPRHFPHIVASVDVSTLQVTKDAITEKEVLDAQKLWAQSIVQISAVHADEGDYVSTAAEAAGKLYAYGHGNVLFKPTKATKNPFRPSPDEAMSYFVGAEAMTNNKFYGEDFGFAINGGRGWKHVEFRNHQIELLGSVALAMGEYFFTDAFNGDVARVEYSFAYKRCEDGNVRICLHHSSAPFDATVTRTEMVSASS